MLQCLVFVMLLKAGQLEQSIAYRTNTKQAVGKPFSWNQSKRGSVYLNANRPLWILDDSTRQQDMQRHILTPIKPLRTPFRQQKHKLTRANSRNYKLPNHIKLPSHYVHSGRRTPRKTLAELQQQAEKQQQHIFDLSQTFYMPHFDNLPGEDNADPLPVFIYNGPKGELLLNTMLSVHKYPMQEPVPGQILYPPTAPLFRPKPIVQRYRHNNLTDALNLTLIPFYAHEAIDPRSLQFETNAAIMSTTAAPATVLYAAPVETKAGSKTTSLKKKQKKQRSKWQDYKAYHSQHEVRWQPRVSIEQLQTTTPFPLALASPLRNHRLEEFETTTTSMPFSPKQLQSLKDADENSFNIVYMDASIEKPQASQLETIATTTPPSSVQSSRYAVSQAFYAFPVFTLAKLLKPLSSTELVVQGRNEQPALQPAAVVDVQPDEAASDTWFILNSRYKGHVKYLNNHRLSSKYVQNSARNAVQV